MNFLLDTHILIWSLTDDPKLSLAARDIINDMTNRIYYSTVSVWEIAIKNRIHPLRIPCSEIEILDYCRSSDMVNMPLLDRHIIAMSRLFENAGDTSHKDPFDRILLAQTVAESMIFVTHDQKLSLYKNASVKFV